jgi:hypothetical protein
MPIVLRGGPLDGQPWPGIVAGDDTTVSTRVGRGDKVVYGDTGERDPVTGRRIFAYRPLAPKPIGDSADRDPEDDDDDE